jgi:hypothetical protein
VRYVIKHSTAYLSLVIRHHYTIYLSTGVCRGPVPRDMPSVKARVSPSILLECPDQPAVFAAHRLAGGEGTAHLPKVEAERVDTDNHGSFHRYYIIVGSLSNI